MVVSRTATNGCVGKEGQVFPGLADGTLCSFVHLGSIFQGKREGILTYGREVALHQTWDGYLRSEKNSY